MTSIPTKQGMVISQPCYVSSVRTTLCDIMCTVNASLLVMNPKQAPSLKPLTATLPYKTTKQQTIKKKVTNETLFQQLIGGENRQRMEKDLKRDKEMFFAQLKQEKWEVEQKRHKSAVKIQALFRGYRKRRNKATYVRRKMRRKPRTQNDMQDELCTLAAKLGLKPIDGLSLEARSKTSRRKEKIMNAAAFRLHRFFDMICKRSKAQRRLVERRQELLNFAAKIVTRAVRYVKVKKFVKKCESIKHQQMALKIQCRTRIFHAREKVRARAKERHMNAKRMEAAIIIQRNLAPQARAYNLHRLTMVTMRAYQHMADEVVSLIENYLLEGGIQSVVDVFTDLISDKIDVVYPKVEDSIEETLICDAVLVEMHIWLEEQMLAILAENQRISEERSLMEAKFGSADALKDANITWDNLPMEYYNLDVADTPLRCFSPMLGRSEDQAGGENASLSAAGSPSGGPNVGRTESGPGPSVIQSAVNSVIHSAATSRLASPNVGDQAYGEAGQPLSRLVPPSVRHRSHFLRSSTGVGSAMGIAQIGISHPPMRGSISSSFNLSPQHYRSVMLRLSSVDMNHNSKYQAALLAANAAANGDSFSNGQFDFSAQSSDLGSHNVSSRMLEDGDVSDGNSVRFYNNEVEQRSPLGLPPSGGTSPMRPDDVVPSALEGAFSEHVMVEGIAECDEEEDDNSNLEENIVEQEGECGRISESADGMADEPIVHEAVEEPVQNISTPNLDSAPEPELEPELQPEPELEPTIVKAEEDKEEESVTVDETPTIDDSQQQPSQSISYSEQDLRKLSVANFAEAFASMSITSVLNQFGDSVVMGGEIAEDGSTTLLQEGIADQPPDTPHSNASEYYDDGDNASDIGSTYYDLSTAGSLVTMDAERHIEEWEVCRDFTSMSLTEAEKREIDQLFKDTMHAFHKAKYRKASDVLECFLPILRKFPSSDPFHPDVARVQTTIKTIKARILFEQAQYADAKEVFDDALQHRVEVFGKAHFLCLELYYGIGEWHRSQAQYDAAEKYFHQASVSAAALIKMQVDAAVKDDSSSSGAKYDMKLWHAKNRIMLAQAELWKQSGQYYKANLAINHIKSSLKERTCHDAETTRIQETFVCAWTSMLCINGKYAQAISLLQELLDQRRYRYGAKHPKVATVLNTLGLLKLLRSDFAEACEMLEEGLSMRREVYPVDHPAIASSLYAKGVAFSKLGKFPEAAVDMTHSLEMRRLKLGSEHPSVAQSAAGLADIQTQMGDPLRAWKNYSFALSVFRNSYGVEKHRDIAQCLFSMACSAEVRGAYMEAVAYYEQALQIRESVLELFRAEGSVELNLDVELSKVHMAGAYSLVGRLEEAKGFMKEAVKNVTKILGNRNDLVARCLCQLGELCRIRGNYADAKQLYALAFNVIQELFGDDHPLIATIMLLSAENLRSPGMYSEGFELESSAYDVRSYLFGSDNIFTALAVYQRAQLLRDSGKQSDAEKQYLRSLHILVAKLGENNGLYGQVLGDYAECARLSGKISLSEKSFTRAIEIQKASFGEDALKVNETVCNFSLLLMDMHHPKEAANILRERVVPTAERLLGKAHPTTMYARANLALASQFVRFFESQGTDEGSVILDGILEHRDIVGFLDAIKASAFSLDHPWLLRFTEGSQSFASRSITSDPRTPVGNSETGDNGSVQSSVQSSAQSSVSASFSPSGAGYSQSNVSVGAESQQSDTGAFTPRASASSARRPSAQNTMDPLSPSDSDSNSYSQQSYGGHSYSDASSSQAGSMSYSASQSSSVTPSVSQSQTRSQLIPSLSQSNYSTHSYHSGEESRSFLREDSVTRSETIPSTYEDSQTRSHSYDQSRSLISQSFDQSQSQSQSYPTRDSSFNQHSSSHRYSSSNYISQHSAVMEYSDDYSMGSASASVSVSLTPRSHHNRRNFSLTPSGNSAMSRQLTNYEESSIGSWDHLGGDDQVSIDDYFSRSHTLEEDSVESMESLYNER